MKSCAKFARRPAILISVVAVLAVVMSAQTINLDNTTAPPTPGVGHDYIKLINETVNPANGSLSLRIDLPLPEGRGLKIPFALTYSSSTVQRVYGKSNGGGKWYNNSLGSSGGWSNSIPSFTAVQAANSFYNDTAVPPTTYSCTYISNYNFTDWSGATHPLNLSIVQDSSSNLNNCNLDSNLWPSRSLNGGDNFYRAVTTQPCAGCIPSLPSPVQVADSDGTVYSFLGADQTDGTFNQYTPPQSSSYSQQFNTGYWGQQSSIEDRNGNKITVSGSSITDDAGRRILTFSSSGSSTLISLLGQASPYKENWGSAVPVNFGVNPYVFGSYPQVCASIDQNTLSNPTMASITLPNGRQYQFFYDSKYGLLDKIIYPSGGYVSYAWGVNPQSEVIQLPQIPQSGSNAIYSNCFAVYDLPAITKRTVSYDGSTVAEIQTFAYTTNMSTSTNIGWTSKTTTVTTQDIVRGTSYQMIYTYAPLAAATAPNSSGNGAPPLIATEQSIVYKDFSGSVLKTVAKSFGGINGILLTCEFDQLDNGLISGNWYTYGLGGEITDKKEYDYGVVSSLGVCPNTQAPGSPTRETVKSFQSFSPTPIFPSSASIFNRPSSVQVYANGTAGTLMAETDYAYDGTGVASVSSPTGHDETNYGTSYNNRGNATTKTVKCLQTCASAVTTYTYDETGQVLTMTDPCGNGTCSDMGTTQPGHTTTYSYADHYTVLSGSANTPFTPSGNTNAYLTKITDPLGHIENFTYDFNNGQLTAAQDQNDINAGRAGTTYVYNDPFSRPMLIQYPDGGQTEYAYNDSAPSPTVTTCQLMSGTAGATCSPTSPPTGWKTTAATMDGIGHVVQTALVSDPEGITYTATSYDGNSRPYQVYNPTRCTPPTISCGDSTWGFTAYTYDSIGRSVQVAEPDGSNVSTSYLGNQSTTTDEVGNQRTSQTDGLGRVTYVWEAPNSTGYNYETDYAYDRLNNLLSVTQKGGSSNSANWRARTFGYDSLSRLTSAINPESGTITYTYDLNSNLSTKLAPKADQTGTQQTTSVYTYDVLSRVITESFVNPNAFVNRYAYDGATLTGCQQNPPTISSPQNLIGRRSATCGGNSGSSFSYDQMGRVLIESRTNYSPSPFVRKTYAVNYAYNKDGSLQTLKYPSGDVVSYTVGGAGRVTQVIDASNTYVAPFSCSHTPSTVTEEYWPFGGIGGICLAKSGTAGIFRQENYNSRLQPVSVEAVPTNSNPVLLWRTYDFHLGSGDNGNLFGIYDSVDTTGAGSVAFAYDPLNRLQQANSTSTNGTNCWGEVYTIDPWGNLTNRAGVSGMGSCLTEGLSATATTKNQLSGIGLQYDAAGNVTRDNLGNTPTYDAKNRISTDAGFTYSYDANGVRMEKLSASSGTMYWPDTSGEYLTETDLTGTINEEYIYFNGQRVARVDRPSGTVHYYFSDHLGSASVITDASGSVQEQYYYYPYGGLVLSSGSDPNHYKFTGKERDSESGLDEFGARYYGSSLGRFMTPDWATTPIDVPYADFGNPQSLNLYSYVKNNPTTTRDPDGHDAWDAILGAANAFGSDFFGGAGRQDSGNGDYKVGQAIGDFGATVVGAGETLLGAGGEVGGVALDATGVGAVAGVPVGVVSTAAVVQGSSAVLIGGAHLLKSANDSSGAVDKSTAQNQERMGQGKAPLDKDGKPVELHHEGQTQNGPVKEMTQQEHRGGENFAKNHTNTGQQPSQINRSEAAKARRQHWKKQVKEQ